ncbi:MAG: hypothetical protein Q4F39_03815, partial [Bacteroidia bacterium]|nr:hypothetical protein [Bacteroidia bacterium]
RPEASTVKYFQKNVSNFREGSFEELESAIEEGFQVIAAVDGGELTGNQLEEEIEDAFYGQISDHCVVVLAVEDDAVTLYDPAFGCTPLSVSRSHFLDAWDDSNRFYVSISAVL